LQIPTLVRNGHLSPLKTNTPPPKKTFSKIIKPVIRRNRSYICHHPIHLSSSRIYIGQTINLAYKWFQQHWNSRSTKDFRNGCLWNQKLLCYFILVLLECIHRFTPIYQRRGQRPKIISTCRNSIPSHRIASLDHPTTSLPTFSLKCLNNYIAARTANNRRNRYNRKGLDSHEYLQEI